MLEIKYVDPKQLIAAEYNPRKISQHSFNGLCESIKRFGFVDPVIVNLKTENLVGGHQRVAAAIELGLDTVPVVYVNLTEIEEKALNVSLNNKAIAGHFDESLQDLLEEIKNDLGEDFSLNLNLDEALSEIDFSDWDTETPPDQLDEPEGDLSFSIKLKGDPNKVDEEQLKEYLKSFLKENNFDVQVS